MTQQCPMCKQDGKLAFDELIDVEFFRCLNLKCFMFKYKITEAEYVKLVDQMQKIETEAFQNGQQSVTKPL